MERYVSYSFYVVGRLLVLYKYAIVFMLMITVCYLMLKDFATWVFGYMIGCNSLCELLLDLSYYHWLEGVRSRGVMPFPPSSFVFLFIPPFFCFSVLPSIYSSFPFPDQIGKSKAVLLAPHWVLRQSLSHQ